MLVRHALAKYTTPGKTYGDVLLELIEEYPTEAYLQEMDGGTGRSPHLAERAPYAQGVLTWRSPPHSPGRPRPS